MRQSAGHYQGRKRENNNGSNKTSSSGMDYSSAGASYHRPAAGPTDFRYSQPSGAPGLVSHQPLMPPPRQSYSPYGPPHDRWQQHPPSQQDPYLQQYRPPPWPESDRSTPGDYTSQRGSYQRSGQRASYNGPSSSSNSNHALPPRPSSSSRPENGMPPYDPRMPPPQGLSAASSSSSMQPGLYPPAYPPYPPPPHIRPDTWPPTGPSPPPSAGNAWGVPVNPNDQRPPTSSSSAAASRKQSRTSHGSSSSSKRQKLDGDSSRQRLSDNSRKPPAAGKSSYTRSDRTDREGTRRGRSPSVDSVGRVRRRRDSRSGESSDEEDHLRRRRRSRSPTGKASSRDYRRGAAGTGSGHYQRRHRSRSRSPSRSPARSVTSSRGGGASAAGADRYSSARVYPDPDKRSASGRNYERRQRDQQQKHYRGRSRSRDRVDPSAHYTTSARGKTASRSPSPDRRRYRQPPAATPSPGEVSPGQVEDDAHSQQQQRSWQQSPPISISSRSHASYPPPPHHILPARPQDPAAAHPHAHSQQQQQSSSAPISFPNANWAAQTLPAKPKGLPDPPASIRMPGFKAAFNRPSAQTGSTAQMRKFFPGDEEDSSGQTEEPQATTEGSRPGPPEQQQRPSSPLPPPSAAPSTASAAVAPSGKQSPIPGLSVEEPPAPQLEEPPAAAETPAQTEHLPPPPASASELKGKQAKQTDQLVRRQQEDIYERLAQVGEGTYGKVYKARNTQTGSTVALKRIRMEAEKDGFPITSVREIKLLQSLRHPNVVSLSEMMVAKGGVYMVFEYLEHDLTGVLRCPEVTFTPAHCKSIMKQLLQGLSYIHNRGVLHRDLKGSNILLSELGSVKIADFGLARFYARKGRQHDHTNRVITQWYKPPELLYGATMYGAEVDVWSAGCIFLELFSRRPVFQGQDEIHQLDVIYKLMGTPRLDDWPQVGELPWYELVKPREAMPRRLRDHFGNTKWLSTEGGLQLAEALLELNPGKRPSAEAALAMPYFTSEDPLPERPTIQGIGEWHEWEAKLAKAALMRKANPNTTR